MGKKVINTNAIVTINLYHRLVDSLSNNTMEIIYLKLRKGRKNMYSSHNEGNKIILIYMHAVLEY